MSTGSSRSREGRESRERAWDSVLSYFPRHMAGLEAALAFSLALSTWGWLCYGWLFSLRPQSSGK